nr:LysE family translocator [uncultured Sphaerochaeta sp.]
MLEESYSLFITAFILGFSSGISPGVLFTVIISESIQHGAKAGIKIAIAPLMTDAPIVLLSYFVFSQLAQVKILLTIITFAGGLYLVYLGYKNIIAIPVINLESIKTNSLRKGIITNFLSPSPYIFWMSIGAPLLDSSFGIGISTGITFLLIFYILLIGLKITIAYLASRVRRFIGGIIYKVVIRILGIVLAALGVFYIYNGYLNL